LALVREDAPQRRPDLREVFHGLRWLVRTGAEWRRLPHDFPFPRGDAVYPQTRRWLDAGVFAALVHDLRTRLRLDVGRLGPPSAALLERRTLQSTPERGGRAGDDGHQRRKGSKRQAAVATRGHLRALPVPPADAQDRAPVAALAAAVPEATGQTVPLAYVDQGYTGAEPAAAAARSGIRLEVVKRPAATRGFVLLPKRWVVERGFAWAARFRRLARDSERLPAVVAGLHFVAFACRMLHRLIPVLLVHNRL
jgi:transposase